MSKITDYIKDIGAKWFSYFFLIGIVLLLFFFVKSCREKQQAENKAVEISHRVDTITKIINGSGDTVRIVTTLHAINQISDSIDYYKKMAADVADVKQKEVERLTSLVTVLKQKPNAKTDTVYMSDSMPVYSYHYETKWLSYGATASRDSLRFNPALLIRDSMDLILTRKKNVLQARIVNYNPYSSVQWARDYDFRSFVKPSRMGIGFSAGATYFNGSVQPYIGVGLNYNLIQFNK